MDEILRTQILEVSQCNPGALRVCIELVAHIGELSIIDFGALQTKHITGEDLWYLYSRCCDNNIAQVHACIMQGTAEQQLQAVPQSSFYQE